MDEQVPASQEFEIPQAPQPQMPQMQQPDFAAMRKIAMQQAIAQHQQAKQREYEATIAAPEPQAMAQQPNVVYVRRNFTVAELLVTFLIACGVVLGGQFTWHFFTDLLPRIEIREK